MGGMSIGSKHNWNYTTKSHINLGRGRFVQYQSKGRNVTAPKGSGMPTKSNLIWAINGKFYVKKIGPQKWIRITRGTKGQAGFKLPKQKWQLTKRKKELRRRRYRAK